MKFIFQNFFNSTLLIFLFISAILFGCDKGKKLSLVITPFENASKDESFDFLSLGIPDELIEKLLDTKKVDIVSLELLLKKLDLFQLVGKEINQEDFFKKLQHLKTKPEFSIFGKYTITEKKKAGLKKVLWLKLSAAVVRNSDQKKVAEASEENEIKYWSILRGLLAIKIAKKLGLAISAEDQKKLKEANTGEFLAFKDNYFGRIFYYKFLETRSKKLDEEAMKYKNLALFYYNKALSRDRNYLNAKLNYALNYDPIKIKKYSKAERIQRAQYKVNKMVIYAFQYKIDSVYDISAWLNEYGGNIKTVLKSLPPGYVLEIQGHTDASGPEKPWRHKPGNISISTSRAQMIYNQMIKLGIQAQKIRYTGFGSSRSIPWLDKRDPANRRVTFEIVKMKR